MLKIFKTEKITLGIILLVFFIKAHAESDSAESYLQKDSIKQGIIVESNSNEVEVFINGKSHGEGEELKIELPPGEYKITGKRENYFDDVEREEVIESEIISVSLSPKKIRIQILPNVSLIYISSEGKFDLLISINLGCKYKRNYWEINYTTKFDSFSDELNIFGLSYKFIFFENEFFISEAGVNSGFYMSKKITKKWGFFLVPNLAFHFGTEHVKLYVGITSYNLKQYGLIFPIESGFAVCF